MAVAGDWAWTARRVEGVRSGGSQDVYKVGTNTTLDLQMKEAHRVRTGI